MQDMKTIKVKLHLVATDRIMAATIGADIEYLHNQCPMVLEKEGEYKGMYRCHNIYFTSDEEIKEGEHYLVDNIRVREVRIATEHTSGVKMKIVASTDPKLTKGHLHMSAEDRLDNVRIPQPTKQLVEAYCKKPFDECLIEMVRIPKPIHNYPLNAPWQIKVNSYNEITCHPVKEKMYTLADVDMMMNQMLNELMCRQEPMIRRGSTHSNEISVYVTNWMNKIYN